MLAFLGLFLLGLGALSVFQVLRARKRIHAMVTTETVASHELRELHQAAVGAVGPGAFRRRIEAAGTARPHPSGPLTSQLGRTECVWFRTRITRKYETRTGSGNGGNLARKSQVVSDFLSASPFLVEDGSGATVVVPAKGIVDHAPKTVDHFEPYRPGDNKPLGFLDIPGVTRHERTLGHQQEEWVLRDGAQFYVRGEARDDERGELTIGAPSDGSPFLMTGLSEQDLIAVERNKKKIFGIMAWGGLVLGPLALGGHWLLQG
ncbi:GIDE domain-containing protein [Streptomyces sp. Pv4-95]|uniref:GIDE domain-containing protein n=1 Tax=Streptomyces sp. Pv4-95 TaxID=3049543 RepID=UPI003891F619